MSSIKFQIESSINELSFQDQLLLIERLAHRLQKNTIKDDNIEMKLTVMSNDPEIQTELKKIDEEFSETESDGLRKI